MSLELTHPTRGAVLRHSAIALAVGLALAAGSAQAQQTTGSVNGRATKGDVITVVNKAIGLSRQVAVERDGSYSVAQLPAGEYVVTVKRADGSTRSVTVDVAPGKGANADFQQLAQVVVTGTSIKSIDTKSVESSQVLSKGELDRIPVLRDVTAITLLAPGATQGDGRIGASSTRGGNVASLGGASPAENAYYINGFNVTNIVNGVAFNSVPYEGVANQDVKTGGYGASYGRSLGGVISVTTKRGTDEWKGGANISFEPGSLRGSSVYAKKDVPTSTNPADWYLTNRPGSESETKANIWAGGPLIADKLYAFALIQAASIKRDTYGATQQTDLSNSTPQYLLKFDWNVTKNNTLEFTSFSDKSKDEVTTWKQVNAYEKPKGDRIGVDTFTSGGQTNILKWTSVINDDFNISALYGQGKYDRTSAVETALTCNWVRDERTTPRKVLGCSTGSLVTDPGAIDKRTAYRVDLEYVLGSHTLRAGLDAEVYDTRDGSVAPGPGNKRYQVKNMAAGAKLANGYVNNGPAGAYVEVRQYTNGGTFKTENSAWYLEDNIQATKNLFLSVGLRSESFTNKNADGNAFIKVTNTLAPRLGVAWDVKGNADLKVFSNYGRYYIPVYANTNVRLSGLQRDVTDYYAFGGSFSNDKFSLPVLGAALGPQKVNSAGAAPDPRTIVDPNIKPMYQDEFILGFNKALSNRWSVGVKYTHRDLKNGMDDICGGEASKDWAVKNGYTPAQAAAIGDTIDHCFLGNPGRDLTANVDLDGTGKLTAVTIPNAALLFPQKPTRKYDALEFTFERSWDKKWSLAGSYVLAFSKGNTEGYVKSDIGQDDAGISQDWDYPGLMEGANGYLPNDRRHTFKAFGSFAATDELRLGANVIVQSGRPKNCLGYYAGTLDSQSINYGSSSFWCGGKLSNRGTGGRLAWFTELNLQATYTPKLVKGLTLSVDLLNVFNKRTIRGIDEAGEDSAGTPSTNFGNPVLDSLQKPRRVRLLAQYEF